MVMNKIVKTLVALIIVLGLAYFAYVSLLGGSGLIPSGDGSAKEGYSAVFLDNDQVYFGKVKSSGGVLVLTDIYYIRLNQPQPQQEGEEQIEPQLTLVKLGEQIHGPVDEMRINQDHVLFVERLKDESTVVRAIGEYQKTQQAGTAETPINQQPATQQPATPATETPATETPATTPATETPATTPSTNTAN